MERSKLVDKRKQLFHFKVQGALTWIYTICIPKPPIRPYPITNSSISLIDHSTAILSPVLMLQSELQASPPMSLEKKGHFSLSTGVDLSFFGMLSMTHVMRSCYGSLMSWEPILTAAGLTFLMRGIQWAKKLSHKRSNFTCQANCCSNNKGKPVGN